MSSNESKHESTVIILKLSTHLILNGLYSSPIANACNSLNFPCPSKATSISGNVFPSSRYFEIADFLFFISRSISWLPGQRITLSFSMPQAFASCARYPSISVKSPSFLRKQSPVIRTNEILPFFFSNSSINFLRA